MKKTKCMGTSKNKRAMSGGRGKIGKYTQKFKRSYKRFVKIGDTGDDESRFKKMDEWGRMRNIYNFLKIQNDKYKGSAGTETTAWEKMNEKMKDNNHYKSTISCFEKYDNRILSEGECIPEEDYMKGDTGAPEVSSANDVSGKTENTNENAAVETDANTEVTPVVDTVGQPEAPADVSSDSESSNTGETEATPKDPYASNDADNIENAAVDAADTASEVPADVSSDSESSNTVTPAPDVSEAPAYVSYDSESSNTEAPAPDASVVQPGIPVDEASASKSSNTEAPALEVSEAPADVSSASESSNTETPATVAEVQPGTDEAPAPAPEADADTDDEKQDGGRSKRRQKSSRRSRGKSMKSKKGRKTRRKHRAGRH